MSKLRADLDAILDRLARALPGVRGVHTEKADFWPAFAGEADEIVDNAGRADYEQVRGRLDVILAGTGVTHGPGVE